MVKRVILSGLMLLVPALASATTITIDNFENGNLNAWTSNHGQIVADPLNASNHVVHFTSRISGGDIWTTQSFAPSGNDWWLSWDYLGSPAGPQTGGAIGLDPDQQNAGPGEHWLGAASNTCGNCADMIMTGDGTWHHYVAHMTRTGGTPNMPAGPVFFKLEDWDQADLVAGNAFFDNIVLTDVDPNGNPSAVTPEPASLTLLATGLVSLIRRRSRA